MGEDSELGIDGADPNSYSASRRDRMRPLEFCDATVVDAIGETVQLSFMVKSRDVSDLVWPATHTQPTRVALDTVIEEVARVRMSVASANDLAMNLLLELSEKFGLNEEALQKNFDKIRHAARKYQTEKSDADR